MSPTLAVLIMVVVGGQFALQAPINARLGSETGRVTAALVSFLVGTAFLAIAVLVAGGLDDLSRYGQASYYEFCGGVIGAAFVLTALATVPIIGAGGVAAATITGQMIGSVALDGAGALGLDAEPITVARIGGALLLMVGTALILGGGAPPRDDTARGERRLAVVAIVVAGVLLATQAPINAQLGDAIGSLDAAFVNFAVGSLVLALAVALSRSGAGLSIVARVPRSHLLGGLIGAVYVAAAVALVRTIGAGGIAAATITGQLIASVALDRVGAFGLDRRPLTPLRIAAVGLLAGGTYLIVA